MLTRTMQTTVVCLAVLAANASTALAQRGGGGGGRVGGGGGGFRGGSMGGGFRGAPSGGGIRSAPSFRAAPPANFRSAPAIRSAPSFNSNALRGAPSNFRAPSTNLRNGISSAPVFRPSNTNINRNSAAARTTINNFNGARFNGVRGSVLNTIPRGGVVNSPRFNNNLNGGRYYPPSYAYGRNGAGRPGWNNYGYNNFNRGNYWYGGGRYGYGWNNWRYPGVWGLGLGLALGGWNNWAYGPWGGGFGGYGYGGWSPGYYAYSPSYVVTAPVVPDVSASFYGGTPTYANGDTTPPAAPVATPAAATQPESYSAAGEAAFRTGDYNGAIQSLRHALVDDPGNGGAVLLLGQSLFATGQFNESAGAIQEGVRLLDADNWGTIVGNYQSLNQSNAAFTDQLRKLEAAVAKEPADPALRFLAGYEYGFLGYPKEAVAEFDRVLKTAPQDQAAKMLRDYFAPQIGGANDKRAAVANPTL